MAFWGVSTHVTGEMMDLAPIVQQESSTVPLLLEVAPPLQVPVPPTPLSGQINGGMSRMMERLATQKRIRPRKS
jgi:hypothetical protein